MQLLLEDLCGIVAAAQNLVARVLGGKIVTVPGIVLQHPANNPLGVSVVVGIGGVKIVYAVVNGVAGHPADLLLVNAAVGPSGQAHGAEAQRRQLFVLKIAINHGLHSFSLDNHSVLSGSRYRSRGNFDKFIKGNFSGCRFFVLRIYCYRKVGICPFFLMRTKK